MTTCLLCPAPAVADGLCVDDGARLWMAQLWLRDPHMAAARVEHALWVQPSDTSKRPAWRDAILWHLETGHRVLAALDLSTIERARAFLDRHEAAHKASKATS